MLHRCGEQVENVVFPHSGVATMTIRLPSNVTAGVSLVGRDGIIGGFAAAAGVPAVCDAEVHISGSASRIPASAFRDVLDQSPALRRTVARFHAAMLAQAQQTALCNAVHSVDARLCWWLLEVFDRCGDRKVPLTQAALAQLLGVRRTTVTLMAGRLEAAGVLNCRRGAMHIVDIQELQHRSCGCYTHLKNYQTAVFAEPADPTVSLPESIPAAPAQGSIGIAS